TALTEIYTLSLHDALPIFGLMHDWLSWNEARWALGQKAVQSGIHPRIIEGGLEWNGWDAPAIQPELPPAPTNVPGPTVSPVYNRSEEHTSELQSPYDLVCR